MKNLISLIHLWKQRVYPEESYTKLKESPKGLFRSYLERNTHDRVWDTWDHWWVQYRRDITVVRYTCQHHSSRFDLLWEGKCTHKTQNKIATAFLPRFFHHNVPTFSNSSSDAALKISRALGTAGNCCSQHKAHCKLQVGKWTRRHRSTKFLARSTAGKCSARCGAQGRRLERAPALARPARACDRSDTRSGPASSSSPAGWCCLPGTFLHHQQHQHQCKVDKAAARFGWRLILLQQNWICHLWLQL